MRPFGRRAGAGNLHPGGGVKKGKRNAKHLVQNLLSNARRHGSGMDVEGSLRSPAIEVALVTRADPAGRPEVVLAVTDDGPGFPDEVLDHAFERFVGGGRGTGLGLWIVRWIAELHGGTAIAANRPAGGAGVWVSLPAGPGPDS